MQKLLKNLKILDISSKCIFESDILIQDDKIKQIAKNISVENVDSVSDLSGSYAMPGIIDAHSHIGMWEDSLDFEGADGNESSDPITPHMRAIDAINPFDRCFEEARAAGVCTVMTGPGSANVIGGSFAVLKTYGSCVEDMIVKEPAAIKVAFGENPKHVYSEQKMMPMTRMATAALLRDTLNLALEYKNKLESDDPDKMPDFDSKYHALLPLLRKEIPLKAHAHRADDILTAIRIAKEFDLDLTIDHATDSVIIAEILKRENIKLIVGPLLCDRSKPELKSLSMETPRKLHEAGLSFALMTDHPVTPSQYLPVVAALCVREGLDEWTALKSITINPAEILGVSDSLGSLDEGKNADIVILDGPVLDIRSHVIRTYISGNCVYSR